MAQHALCMIDNDSTFSIICDIYSRVSEWEELAEFITTRIKDVASGRAESTAYTSWYGPQRDNTDYLYKYGDFPTVYVMSKNNDTYTYDDNDWESDNVWGEDEIIDFFTNKYDGEEWRLALDNIPDLFAQR